MIIKYIYSVFIGVLLATFIGVGIAAFYPTPKYPDVSAYPGPLADYNDPKYTEQLRAEQQQRDQMYKKYQEETQVHSRNVSIIALVFAIIILGISLTAANKLPVITDGLLFGSVLTLIYSITMGFATQDNIFRFIVVTVGLVISLFLGYLKFIPQKRSSKR